MFAVVRRVGVRPNTIRPVCQPLRPVLFHSAAYDGQAYVSDILLLFNNTQSGVRTVIPDLAAPKFVLPEPEMDLCVKQVCTLYCKLTLVEKRRQRPFTEKSGEEEKEEKERQRSEWYIFKRLKDNKRHTFPLTDLQLMIVSSKVCT